MEIKVNATLDEKLKLVNDCLTTGLPTLALSGISLDYDDDAYDAARVRLAQRMPEADICLEDVQTEMLRLDFDLNFTDTEGGDATALNLALIEKNWDKVRSKDLMEYMNENWDSDTADNIMQMLLYGEIVYG